MKNLSLLLALLLPLQAAALPNTGKVDAGFVEFTTQGSNPATPASGKSRHFVKTSDGLLYKINSSAAVDNYTLKSYVDGLVAGGSSLNVSTKTANYTLTNTNDVIILNCSTACSITMHSVASATSKAYRFINKGYAEVTFVRNASDTFNSDTGLTLGVDQVNWPSFTAIPDGGTTWLISN